MDMFQRTVIWTLLIHIIFCQKPDNSMKTFTNLDHCKLTQSGHEYQGTISTTVDGVRCQSWYGENQLHEVDPTIKDTDFPDGDKKQAKNYCRNPTSDPNGPWCYTTEIHMINDVCDIPLCNYGNCRISGTGAEYGGRRNFTHSGKFCLSWNKEHKFHGNQTHKFLDENFPDKSRRDAQKFCRNPTDDDGGPWCYVENEDYEIIEKEYCDIPFCDDKDCLVFTREAKNYSTVTQMNTMMGNMTIWIKLWNPLHAQRTAARLLLSNVPIPMSAKKIAQDWKAGVEIVISNVGSGFFYPNYEDELNFDYTPHILVGTKWTGLSITWVGGTVSVSYYGSTQPLFTGDYSMNNSHVNSSHSDGFQYYGLMADGPGVLWSTEFCQQTCEVHTTFGVDFLRLWPMHKDNITYEIQFFVRADRNIAVQLYQNPGAMFPCFTLTIGYIDVVTLVYQETALSPKQYLRDLINTELLNYLSWKEFHISIFGPHFRLFSSRHYGKSEILYARNDFFYAMRWFSVGSENVIAHWTFFCAPAASDAVKSLSPPNCISNPTDYKYVGSQWITKYHKPCVPWSSNDVPETERMGNHFPDGSAYKALNRCRNPTYDVKGPYCYAFKVPQSTEISKQYCEIRSCRSTECRVAGTGNDYIGKLSKTRSGRTCAPWVSDQTLDKSKLLRNFRSQYPNHSKSSIFPNLSINKTRNNQRVQLSTTSQQIHPVDSAYLNDTLYPEQSARQAKNFCRDPSRSIAGPWCYTMDPLVPQDLCNVQDCEKNGPGNDRRQYVLPEHRNEGLRVDLKSWEPDHPDSITFGFTANDGLRSRYTLRVGAANNEQVFLFYLAEEGDLELVMKKTLPHLIYMGMWTSFVVRIPRGKVELYYAGAPDPIFEWKHPEPLRAFVPIYYYYTSDYSHTVAVAFDCSSSCTVEVTETDELTRILPVTIRNADTEFNSKKLVLIIRAKGVVLIPLLLFPATSEYYGLKLGEMGAWIVFFKNTTPNITIVYEEAAPYPALFYEHSWTNITLIWNDKMIRIYLNSTSVFRYKTPRPILFYYFTIIVKDGGKAIWSANCEPPDIDGAPQDGGWSDWGPWQCSVSCNGGFGSRTRLCNNPPPNIKGEPCMGPSSMTGRCNEMLCGDITDETIKMIKQRIKRVGTALSVQEGQSITITSDDDINSRVIHESPDSEIKWSHNGMFMDLEKDRITIDKHNIVISYAKVNDSGVYTYTVRRVDGTYMILEIISLVVYPTRAIVIRRETQSMTLICNCAVLGYLYANLKIFWLINKKIWKNYGTTLPISVNVDVIPVINSSHHGLWECVVKQDDFNFYWTTNAIMINVIGAPNWKTYLMEDQFTKPIFGSFTNENYVGALAIIISVLLILSIIMGTICFIKLNNRLKGLMSKYVIKSEAKAQRQKKEKNPTAKGVLEKFFKLSDNKTHQEEYSALIKSDHER